MSEISVIGLGNIGGGIATNLIRAGYRVRVFDTDGERVAMTVERGGYRIGGGCGR